MPQELTIAASANRSSLLLSAPLKKERSDGIAPLNWGQVLLSTGSKKVPKKRFHFSAPEIHLFGTTTVARCVM